ncbi:hypothetical protein X777_15643 [Ooceraea biroi]|uniref:Uncharacterized protein n=1 Tax=Ooceraea biroi TaxID=2015173 RepID=A0A026VUZ6_OOCBI|nr:hypothetical protein X777_15643 [Ooceraea biroi]
MFESARSSFDDCAFLTVDFVWVGEGTSPIKPEEFDLSSFFAFLDCCLSVTLFLASSSCPSVFSGKLDASLISTGSSFVRCSTEMPSLLQRPSSGGSFFLGPRFFAFCNMFVISGTLKCSKLADNRSVESVTQDSDSSFSFGGVLAGSSSGSSKCSSANDFFFALRFLVVFEGVESLLELFMSCVSSCSFGTVCNKEDPFKEASVSSLPIFIECSSGDCKTLSLMDNDDVSFVLLLGFTETCGVLSVTTAHCDFLFDTRLDVGSFVSISFSV